MWYRVQYRDKAGRWHNWGRTFVFKSEGDAFVIRLSKLNPGVAYRLEAFEA